MAATLSLSTHVLDAERGAPAAGVRVELYEDDRLVAAQETDADGRISDLAGGSVEPGTYRLVFHPPSLFFRRVEVEIELDQPNHYHVPLLVAPYLCTTYRGN